jgi:PPP family 3-phenylpropionic acid transporter
VRALATPLACMRLLGQMVPPGLAATAQAIYGTVAIGAMTSLLTLTSGTLYGQFGAGGFWAMAGLCFFALPFITMLRSVTRAQERSRPVPTKA